MGDNSGGWAEGVNIANNQNGNGGLDALIKAIVGGKPGGSGAGTQQQSKKPIDKAPSWAFRQPDGIVELLRQLSANAGQTAMPGGLVGAAQIPAFGAGGKPQIMSSMKGYGQRPGMGEARFFHQTMNGGMAPIWSYTPLGVPQDWNPLGLNPPETEKKKD